MDKLLNIIQSFKANQQAGTSKGGWVTTTVVMLIALVTVAVLAWQQFKAGKKLAKLLHEKAVKEEEQHQAEVDATLSAGEESKQAALVIVADLRLSLQRLEKEAEALESTRNRARVSLGKISDWEDIDEFIR